MNRPERISSQSVFPAAATVGSARVGIRGAPGLFPRLELNGTWGRPFVRFGMLLGISAVLSFGSGCSTTSNSPSKSANREAESVSITPGTYRRNDGANSTGEVCEVLENGPLECRSAEEPGSGVYVLDSFVLRGKSGSLPLYRESSTTEPSRTERPVVLVTSQNVQVDGRGVAETRQFDDGAATTPLLRAIREAHAGEEKPEPLVIAEVSSNLEKLTPIVLAFADAGWAGTTVMLQPSAKRVRLDCMSDDSNSEAEQNSTDRWWCIPRPPNGGKDSKSSRFTVGGTYSVDFSRRAGDYCSKRDIRRTVKEAEPKIKACWEQRLARSPVAKVKLYMQWRIRLEDGSTYNVRIRRSSGGDKQFHRCVRKVVRHLQFAKPDGGECIVNYPFHFSSDGPDDNDDSGFPSNLDVF